MYVTIPYTLASNYNLENNIDHRLSLFGIEQALQVSATSTDSKQLIIITEDRIKAATSLLSSKLRNWSNAGT